MVAVNLYIQPKPPPNDLPWLPQRQMELSSQYRNWGIRLLDLPKFIFLLTIQLDHNTTRKQG
jgi:hypothetical protein